MVPNSKTDALLNRLNGGYLLMTKIKDNILVSAQMANYQTFVSLRKRFVNIIFASKAVSGGQQDFLAIAIAAQAGEQFVGPCGACRFAWSPYTLSTCSI